MKDHDLTTVEPTTEAAADANPEPAEAANTEQPAVIGLPDGYEYTERDRRCMALTEQLHACFNDLSFFTVLGSADTEKNKAVSYAVINYGGRRPDVTIVILQLAIDKASYEAHIYNGDASRDERARLIYACSGISPANALISVLAAALDYVRTEEVKKMTKAKIDQLTKGKKKRSLARSNSHFN